MGEFWIKTAANYQEMRAQEVELDRAAREERDSARERAVQRQERLVAALANQRANFAAQGTTSEGSPSVIANEDRRKARRDDLVDRAGLDSRLASLTGRKRRARSLFQTRTLLDAYESGARINRRGSVSSGGG